jgi:hypothetical protein
MRFQVPKAGGYPDLRGKYDFPGNLHIFLADEIHKINSSPETCEIDFYGMLTGWNSFRGDRPDHLSICIINADIENIFFRKVKGKQCILPYRIRMDREHCCCEKFTERIQAVLQNATCRQNTVNNILICRWKDLFHGNGAIGPDDHNAWCRLHIIKQMNYIPASLITAYTRIMHPVNGIKCQNMDIVISFVNANKESITCIASKHFVCRLQIWRIRLTETSTGRKKVNDNYFIFIQLIEQRKSIAINILDSKIKRGVKHCLRCGCEGKQAGQQNGDEFLHRSIFSIVYLQKSKRSLNINVHHLLTNALKGILTLKTNEIFISLIEAF